MIQEIGFALDSPVEEAGFELLVPHATATVRNRFSRLRDRDRHHAGKLEDAALKPAQAYRTQSLQPG
jgi:hypothetical protein